MTLRAYVLLALVGPGSGALADDAGTVFDKVEIVGSRISRISTETALPVQIIRREEIDRSGVQTTEELLARVSANTNGFVDALNIGNDSNPGFSGASLRGLGSTTTLVLLNGRRLANYAFTAQAVGVDLHTIPLAAIERVEILKDGASALYGSDAIAGVINFVLREDYQGVTASVFAGASEHGGGSQTREVLSFGFGDPNKDGYNAFAVVEHRKDDGLAARDRSFSSTSFHPTEGLDSTSNNTFPGNISLGHQKFANPAAPICTDTTVFNRGGCAYDYPRQTDDLAPLEQTSILGRGTLRLNADHELFGELLYETHSALYRIAATPIYSIATNGIVEIDVPTTSPYYPQGLGLTGDIHDVRYRTVTLGPRTSQSRSDNQRALVGIKGNLGGWDYDGALAYSASHAKYSLVSGYVDAVALQNAFNTGLIDPFADSGPAGDALLASTQVQGAIRQATGVTRTVDAHASREIVQLPAGPLALAVGGEWRRETLDDIEQPITATIAGSGFNPPKSGARNVLAAFAELNVPVATGFEAQLAVRRDQYSDFGTTWNPKAALRWQPVKSLLARASIGRGFRAPSLPELYTARATGLFPLDTVGGDAARCPVTQLDSDCEPVVKLAYGGNPKLQPVHSRQMGAGLVFEPTPNWSASVDYWHIELHNDIDSLDPDTIFASPQLYEGKNIIRGPVDPAFPNLPGPITEVDTYNENLGSTRTSGLDITASYRSDPTAFGRFSARLDGTLITQFTSRPPGGLDVSSLGVFAFGESVPRWKHQLTFGWERGPSTITLDQSFRSGYTDAELLPDGSTRRVASYTIWDTQFAYAASKTTTVRVGVRNLFDRDPPFSNQSDSTQVGYDPSYADPRGRFWYLAASIQFR